MSLSKFEKVITIKLGGSTIESDEVLHQLAEDIMYLNGKRIAIIVVHGGGKEITRQMESRGIRPVKVAGLRVTDEATMAIVEEAMNKVNNRICRILADHGLFPERVTGADGLILCEKLAPVKAIEDGVEKQFDLGRVGIVNQVFPQVLEQLINNDKIPVIAPYGCGASGEKLNVNADTAAGSIAGESSDEFILLTDVDGVEISSAGKPKIAELLSASEVDRLIKNGIIRDGMLPKVEACIHALRSGVKSARIVNGYSDHPLRTAASQKSIGTLIIP